MVDPERLVHQFGADLPAGYAIRLQHIADEEVRLEVSSDGIGWRDVGGARVNSVQGLASMLRDSQGELIEHELGYAWPRCPDHGSHPLRPEADGWHCPIVSETNADRSWTYGTLSSSSIALEPPRADGEVRWYLDDLGWGVIAHREGDLFVLFSSIQGSGYRSLREGERVTFDVAEGRQGKFRRAERVRSTP